MDSIKTVQYAFGLGSLFGIGGTIVSLHFSQTAVFSTGVVLGSAYILFLCIFHLSEYIITAKNHPSDVSHYGK